MVTVKLGCIRMYNSFSSRKDLQNPVLKNNLTESNNYSQIAVRINAEVANTLRKNNDNIR